MMIKVCNHMTKLVVELELDNLSDNIDNLILEAKSKLKEINRLDKLKILELLPQDATFLVKLYCLIQCVSISNLNDEINELIIKSKHEFSKSSVSKDLMFAIIESYYNDMNSK